MKGKRKKFIAGGVLLVILAVGAAVGVKSYQDKMKNRLWSSKWEDSFCNLHNNNYMANGILYEQDCYIRFCDNASGKDDLICVDQNPPAGHMFTHPDWQAWRSVVIISCTLQHRRRTMGSVSCMWRILRERNGKSLQI